jgi:peptidoglycan/LPS O-acetylase OafA/YrhL
LFPALYLLLIVYCGYLAIFARGKHLLAGVASVFGAILYVNNWLSAAGHGPPWGMDHLWSLAIEEQFYLLWPLALWFMLRRNVTRRTVLLVTATAAASSALLRAVLFALTHTPRIGYCSTFTRLDGLLLGCLLAQIFSWQMAPAGAVRFLRSPLVGYAAFGALIWFFFQFRNWDSNTYYFGMALSVLTAAVLLSNQLARAVDSPQPQRKSLLDMALTNKVVMGIGKRAYSLYLWQNLVESWLRGPLLHKALYWPTNVVVTFALAEVSYRFVELRWLRRPLGVPGADATAELTGERKALKPALA